MTIENRRIKPSEEMRWTQFYSDGYQEILDKEFPDESLWTFLESGILEDHEQHDALIYFGNHISRKDLVEQVHLWARVLKGMGLDAGDEILLFGPTVPEFIYIMLAANMTGLVSIMPNLMSSDGALGDMTGYSKVAFVFDSLEYRLRKTLSDPRFKHVVIISPTHSMGTIKRMMLSPLNRIRHAKVYLTRKYITSPKAIRLFGNYCGVLSSPRGKDQISYIFCSSGTTRQGKSNQISMSNDAMISMFRNALSFNMKGAPFKPGSTSYCPLPPLVCTGFFVLVLAPLLKGMTVYLDPRLSPEQFIRNVLKIRPQVTLIPGYYWQRLFMHIEDMIKAGKRPDLSFFRFPVMGGEGCTPEVLSWINNLMKECGSPVALTSGYGLTETFSVSTVDYQPGVFDKDYSKRVVSVGYPFPGVSVGIFDENGNELGYGQRGEIWVKTPALTSGYVKNDVRNHKVLVDGWLHTEDFGEMDERGMLFVYGRMAQHKDAPDGQKVYLFDIANEIRQDPAVKESLACIPEDAPGQQIAVHVAIEPGNTESAEQIIQRLDKQVSKILPAGIRIDGYKIEHGLLRHNMVGKTDYHYYRQMTTGFVRPENGRLINVTLG